MTQQTAVQDEHAEGTPLVITQTNDGYRVYSPAMPTESFLVSGTPEAPECTCPDYQESGYPEWQCVHIAAVLDQLEKAAVSGEAEEKKTPKRQTRKLKSQSKRSNDKPENGKNNGAAMLLKRSVSPDGRIDALSIEFSWPITKATARDIKANATKILKVQEEIAQGFLGGNGKRQPEQSRPEPNDGSIPAQMLDIGGVNTRWGRRLFIAIEANGQKLKLFGNRKRLADTLVAIGYPQLAENIDEGVRINVPCRVTTKPSNDGRYQNVDQVLPAGPQMGTGRSQ